MRRDYSPQLFWCCLRLLTRPMRKGGIEILPELSIKNILPEISCFNSRSEWGIAVWENELYIIDIPTQEVVKIKLKNLRCEPNFYEFLRSLFCICTNMLSLTFHDIIYDREGALRELLSYFSNTRVYYEYEYEDYTFEDERIRDVCFVKKTTLNALFQKLFQRV